MSPIHDPKQPTLIIQLTKRLIPQYKARGETDQSGLHELHVCSQCELRVRTNSYLSAVEHAADQTGRAGERGDLCREHLAGHVAGRSDGCGLGGVVRCSGRCLWGERMWMYGEGSEAGAYFDEDVIDAWRTAWLCCPHINVASLAPHGDTGAPLQ